MELKDRIKKAMDDAGLSAADVTRMTKITSGAITQWLDGSTKSLKTSSARQLEGVTGFSAMWLAEGTGDMYPTKATSAMTMSSVSVTSSASNQPVTVTSIEECAIQKEALHQSLGLLSDSLDGVSHAKRAAIGGLLNALANDPKDAQLLAAIEAFLTPVQPGVESEDFQKSAPSIFTKVSA